MAPQLPAQTQKALKVSHDGSDLDIMTIRVPSPSSFMDGEILIKVHAAGVNHIENYFIQRKWAIQASTMGTTMGGDVLAIGPCVTRFQPGDTIAAFVFAGDRYFQDRGGFQEYAVVLECNALNIPLVMATEDTQIPPGNIRTYEAAASAIGNIVTIGASRYYAFGHTDEKNKTILIYGAATGVGQMAIQYCHYISWGVIAIASKKNQGRWKSIGADVVIDYNTENLKRDVEALNEDIDLYYVTAGKEEGMAAVYDTIRTDKPVHLESLEVHDISYIQPQKPNVTFGFTRAFTCHGRTIVYGDGQTYAPREGIFDKILEFVIIAEKLVKDGTFTHPPIKILQGGLNGVTEGMRILNNNELSNLRLVIRI